MSAGVVVSVGVPVGGIGVSVAAGAGDDGDDSSELLQPKLNKNSTVKNNTNIILAVFTMLTSLILL